MMRVIEKTKDGDMICEDSDTLQLYFQCLCGMIGMYERCLKLNQEEIEAYRKKNLDLLGLYKKISNEDPDIQDRLVSPF